MLATAFAAVVVAALRAVAGKRGDAPGLRIDDAQCVVLGIGDVQAAFVICEALQSKKPRLIVAAIGQADTTAADDVDELSI